MLPPFLLSWVRFLVILAALGASHAWMVPSSSSLPSSCRPLLRQTTTTTTTTTLLGVADDLLYQEQEKLLVSRGALEGELMKDTHSPLKTHVVKGAGSGGGFGGGGGGSKTSAVKAQAKELTKVLKNQGVVRVDKVVSDDTVDQLRAFLYDLRQESEELVAHGKIQPIQRFANVLLRQNRCDMPVPLGPHIVTQALDEIMVQSPVGAIIKNLLSDKAVLYELSCLMSDPGSQRQVVHPDTPYSPQSDDPVLYTCFVALQDITLDMGPTTWLPNTHTLAVHEIFKDETIAAGASESPKDTLLRTQPAVLGTLPKGCCGMYDSRLLHCGGANQSERSRALFYFSFRNPTIGSVGNPGSIRRDMIGKWTLKALQDELKLISKGKPSGNFVSEP